MTTISAMELRRKLGEVLDRAAAGERIVIERDRKPLAVLVSFGDAERMVETSDERVQRSLAALDRLTAASQRMRREHPEWASLSAAQAIREERDRDDGPDI